MNSSLDGAVISSYDYTVNSIGQRTELHRAGSTFNEPNTVEWTYDSYGQINNEKHQNSNNSQSYLYDSIGNRKTKLLGQNERTDYRVNTLNQYTSMTSQLGSFISHDEDGNLLTTVDSEYQWDAENLLVSYSSNGEVTTFQYDYLGRRYAKTSDLNTTYTIYDSWNPIADYESQILVNTRTWGLDLSGSMQGAGGVGGLLAETQVKSSRETYYPSYDGNGNVSEYLNESGDTVAHYEYDAFGNALVSNGALADHFEHKFSTKRQDAKSGLYYYGYRYYDPETGRWSSRDPIEEEGGLNLYGMIENDPLNKWDYLGLKCKFKEYSSDEDRGWTYLIRYLNVSCDCTCCNPDDGEDITKTFDFDKVMSKHHNLLFPSHSPSNPYGAQNIGDMTNIFADVVEAMVNPPGIEPVVDAQKNSKFGDQYCGKWEAKCSKGGKMAVVSK